MMARAARRAAEGVAWLRAAWGRGSEDQSAADKPGGSGRAAAARAESPLAGGQAVTPGQLNAGASGSGGPATVAGVEVPPDGAAVPPGPVAGPAWPGGYPGPAADVPGWLRVSAAWAWRLLLLAALLWVAGRIASLLYLVIVPFAAAILLSALLQPLTARLRRAGLGPLGATWCTLLLAFVLIGGAVWLVTARVEAEYPALVTQVGHTSTQLQSWLARSPLHVRTGNLEKISDNLVNYLSQHRSTVEGAALTGGRIVVELLAGVVL
jgi:AI-2E family transporter